MVTIIMTQYNDPCSLKSRLMTFFSIWMCSYLDCKNVFKLKIKKKGAVCWIYWRYNTQHSKNVIKSRIILQQDSYSLHLMKFISVKTLKHRCDVLHDLVPLVQFKKREKHPWRSVSFSSKVASWSLQFY